MDDSTPSRQARAKRQLREGSRAKARPARGEPRSGLRPRSAPRRARRGGSLQRGPGGAARLAREEGRATLQRGHRAQPYQRLAPSAAPNAVCSSSSRRRRSGGCTLPVVRLARRGAGGGPCRDRRGHPRRGRTGPQGRAGARRQHGAGRRVRRHDRAGRTGRRVRRRATPAGNARRRIRGRRRSAAGASPTPTATWR